MSRIEAKRIAQRSQDGAASVMIVLLLLLLILASLSTALNLGSTIANDAMASENMLQALLAAESGLERATQRFTTGGIACASVAEPTTTQYVYTISNGTSKKTASFVVSQSGTTDFDGVTALPSTQCKVRVVGTSITVNDTNGTSTTSRVTRTLEAVVRQGSSGTSTSGSGSATFSPGNTSFTHTTVAGTDLLLVAPSWSSTSNVAITVASVTFNGQALTQGTAAANYPATPTNCTTSGNKTTCSIRVSSQFWYLVNPPIGTYNVVITMNQPANNGFMGAALNLAGTDPSSPIDTSRTYGGLTDSTGAISASINTGSGNSNGFVVDNLGRDNGGQINFGNGCTGISGASRVQLWDSTANAGAGDGSYCGPLPASSTVNMNWSWNQSGKAWAASLVSIKASSASGSGNKVRVPSGSTGGTSYNNGVYKWREVTVPAP
jgi:hypothetical protein